MFGINVIILLEPTMANQSPFPFLEFLLLGLLNHDDERNFHLQEYKQQLRHWSDSIVTLSNIHVSMETLEFDLKNIQLEIERKDY